MSARSGDAVVFTRLDRLGRSVKMLKQIADELGVKRTTVYGYLG